MESPLRRFPSGISSPSLQRAGTLPHAGHLPPAFQEEELGGRPGLGTHTHTHKHTPAAAHRVTWPDTTHKVTQSQTSDHPPHAAWGRHPADLLLPPPLEDQAQESSTCPQASSFPCSRAANLFMPPTSCPPIADAGLPLVDTSYLYPPRGSSQPTPHPTHHQCWVLYPLHHTPLSWRHRRPGR